MRVRLGMIPSLRESDTMSAREREEYHKRRALFAREVWQETVRIEKALNAHTCSVEASYFYSPRLQIFKLSIRWLHALSDSLLTSRTPTRAMYAVSECSYRTSSHVIYLRRKRKPSPFEE